MIFNFYIIKKITFQKLFATHHKSARDPPVWETLLHGEVDWIQVRQKRTPVGTVINLSVPKRRGISWPAERLLASQGMCSWQFVNNDFYFFILNSRRICSRIHLSGTWVTLLLGYCCKTSVLECENFNGTVFNARISKVPFLIAGLTHSGFPLCKSVVKPVTVAARSKAWNVFARLNTGIVG
jgi:hypothetical protein